MKWTQIIAFIFIIGCISRPRTPNEERLPNLRNLPLTSSAVPDEIKGTIRIPFLMENGVLHVQATINGSPIKFVFDSGASDVTISVTEATYLLKNGYLQKENFTGEQNYVDANGDVNTGVTFRISEMILGSAKLKNVNASVVNSRTASNLLGQSALKRFGKVSIDYEKNEIILQTN